MSASDPRMKRVDTVLIDGAPPVGEIGSSITSRFEEIVQSYPERTAIGSGSWQPAYAQLNDAADALASEVRARCEPWSRVALLHRLDGYLIGSILGVLKAGRVVAAL